MIREAEIEHAGNSLKRRAPEALSPYHFHVLSPERRDHFVALRRSLALTRG